MDNTISIQGTFRHTDCVRVSIDGSKFRNFRCEACASIVFEYDFYMRVYRSKSSTMPRGERDTSRRRRLIYLGNCELIRVAQSSKVQIQSLKFALWIAKVRVVTLIVHKRTLKQTSVELVGRGNIEIFAET